MNEAPKNPPPTLEKLDLTPAQHQVLELYGAYIFSSSRLGKKLLARCANGAIAWLDRDAPIDEWIGIITLAKTGVDNGRIYPGKVWHSNTTSKGPH